MTPCPAIKVYQAMDDVPDGFQYIAYFAPDKTIKPENGEPRQSIELLPVYFRAPLPAVARQKAADWWAAEQEKLAAKEANRAALSARRRAA